MFAFMTQKLVKWTWESHADYGDITTVLHTVEKIISSNVHLRLLPSPHEKGSSSHTHTPPNTLHWRRPQLVDSRLTLKSTLGQQARLRPLRHDLVIRSSVRVRGS